MSPAPLHALAINDISCVGRCSLTVALPLLSSAGIRTSILPTSLLSTHTGGFSGYSFLDLTEEMKKILSHWEGLGLSFDAVYTGYLGSGEQASIVRETVEKIRERDPDALIFCDPVMGDGGGFYAGFDASFAEKMRQVCESGDILVPNVTEACLLLGKKYVSPPFSPGFVDSLLASMGSAFPGDIVLTGVSFEPGEIGSVFLERKTGKADFFMREKIEGFYHGAGDVFASSLLAAMLSGLSRFDAMEVATDFTVASIARTHDEGDDTRYGLAFEPEIGDLLKTIAEKKDK